MDKLVLDLDSRGSDMEPVVRKIPRGRDHGVDGEFSTFIKLAGAWTWWGFMTTVEVQQFVHRVERQYGRGTAAWNRIGR
jgi:hypothetical protein